MLIHLRSVARLGKNIKSIIMKMIPKWFDITKRLNIKLLNVLMSGKMRLLGKLDFDKSKNTYHRDMQKWIFSCYCPPPETNPCQNFCYLRSFRQYFLAEFPKSSNDVRNNDNRH